LAHTVLPVISDAFYCWIFVQGVVVDSTDSGKVVFWEMFLEVFKEKGDYFGYCFHVFALASYVELTLPEVDVLYVICVPCVAFLDFHCRVQFIVEKCAHVGGCSFKLVFAVAHE